MFDDIFKRRKPSVVKLLSYGFVSDGQQCIYTTPIMDGSYVLTVIIENGAVETALRESDTGEPYELYKTNASGTFIGEVRSAIEEVLKDVSIKCFETSVFKQEQTLRIIEHIEKKYGGAPEYLWEKFPENAVFRRADNKKWYAAILTVKRSKLGFESESIAEVIDLRIEPEKTAQLVDNKLYFPGYHMNKKHWFTIVLDGSVPFDELCQRVDDSYRIANKK